MTLMPGNGQGPKHNNPENIVKTYAGGQGERQKRRITHGPGTAAKAG